jgi:hypothetical protein
LCPAYGGIRPFPFLRQCRPGSATGGPGICFDQWIFPIIFAFGFFLKKPIRRLLR